MLVADGGRVLARYVAEERDGRPYANFLEPEEGADLQEVARLAMRDLAGHGVGCRVELGDALLAAGARLERHAHNLRHDLGELPPEPPVAEAIEQATGRDPQEFVAASQAAYGPDHPDFHVVGGDADRHREHFAAILEGRLTGPLLPCSLVALDSDGALVAAALVTRLPADRPDGGGAALIDLFRVPGRPGLGAALLIRVLHRAARDGLSSLGLTVTDGNPALRLYERVGFRRVTSFYVLSVP